MKKYLSFLFVLLLCGCELVVDIDEPFEHAQLVVNAIFTPDSVWLADISLNQSALSNTPFQKVDNAFVVVYQNGTPVDTLFYITNGKYKSDTGKPLVNTEYEVKVTVPGYETVSSNAKAIPSPAQLTGVDMFESNQENDLVTTLTLKFKDDPVVANYYEILVEVEREYYDYFANNVIIWRDRVGIEPSDAPPGDGNENMREEILRDDILFNGKDVHLSFRTRSLQNIKNLSVILHTLTDDYFKYKTTSQLQDDTAGDPFAQPVNVFNNINNGFGIFAGYSQSTFIQSRPQPEITGIDPMVGKVGDHFIISGKNFSESSVAFDMGEYANYCPVVRSTENEIEAIVPFAATTGKIIVYTSGHVLASDLDFVVVE
jgi:hypothetical protein